MSQTIHRRLYLFLIATLAYIICLHIGHLPIWVTTLSLCFGCWRLLIAFDKVKPAKLVVLAPLTIAIGVGILLTYKGYIYRDSCLSLLLIMVMLKLLEAKNKHDYVLITILAYLLIGATFLFSQTIMAFLLSFPAIVLLTALLIQISRQSKTPTELQSIKTASKMILQSMPLMLVLFLLFPRISQPLWGGSVSPTLMNTTGLNESIELNDISQAVKNGSVAFRVQFKDKIPDKSQLYWRGPVLWQINQQRWEVPAKNAHLPYESVAEVGMPVEYTITMEPNHHRWLLLLDMPSTTPTMASYSAAHSALAATPTTTRIRYQARSWLDYRLGEKKLSERALKMSLQLTSANPKTIALGQQWADLAPAQAVQAALKLYQTESFIYTLNPPQAGKNAIDAFLFSSRRGFCEHYATSFVYLMRAAGVPARVVAGYQGGEINKDYLIVRQSDAHAWAEVWLGEQGWVRVDPTSAVAPYRVEQGVSAAIQNSLISDTDKAVERNQEQALVAENALLPIQERIKQYPLLYQGLLRWDSVENNWNQWVIDYSQKRQNILLSSLTGKQMAHSTIAILLIIALLTTVFAMVALFIFNNRASMSKTQKRYTQFLKKLKPYKLQPYAHETASDFAQRVAARLPRNHQELQRIAELYNQLTYDRYNTISNDNLYTIFTKLISQFKPNDAK